VFDDGVTVETYSDLPDVATLDDCADAYLRAFAEPPFSEGHRDAAELRERITAYSTRDGFRVVLSYRDDRSPVAFGLSVTARAGDWWRDRVADFVGSELTNTWLADPITEVVHLAVVPEARRKGLGRSVLAALVDDRGNDVAVLSCHPEGSAAQRLYSSQGWQLLASDFRTRPGQLGYLLMAKRTR
jgi:ribosomal protein S18 acetylase RimI-like enzyme